MSIISEEKIMEVWERSGRHMYRFIGLINECIEEEISGIISTLEQENRQLRARNERLEKEANAG